MGIMQMLVLLCAVGAVVGAALNLRRHLRRMAERNGTYGTVQKRRP